MIKIKRVIILALLLLTILWLEQRGDVFSFGDLPHFYVPRNVIYFSGKVEDSLDIVSFGDWNDRSVVFSAQNNEEKGAIDTDKEQKILIEKAKKIFLRVDLKDKIQDEELLNFSSFEPIRVDEPLIKPVAIVYFLRNIGEKLDLGLLKDSPKKLFERHLFYSQEKIANFQKFGDEIPKKTKLKLIAGYQKNIFSAIDILTKLKSENDKEFLSMLVKLGKTLNYQNKWLQLRVNEAETKKEVDEIFSLFSQKINELKFKRDFSKFVYRLEIPQSGEYEIYEKEISNGENGGWNLIEKKYFKEGEGEYILENNGFGENLVDDTLKISNYSPKTLFKISFRYKTSQVNSHFSINEGKASELFDFELPPTGNRFENFEGFFKSSAEADRALVFLSIPEYENLKIEKIKQPTIMLKKENSNDKNEEMGKVIPKITFMKINPTKYQVKVEGAKESYILVFNESFHKGWKTYVQASNLKPQTYGDTIASYFNGEVKEGTQKNIFLNKATFETWGKKPLPEKRHLLVNSYANAWNITPQDTNFEQNYELIMEFTPQRIFYLGLLVSLIVIMGCLWYFIFNRISLK